MTATLQPSLRYRILGTWQLESYTAIPTDPTLKGIAARPFYPMTKHVTGLLIYSTDGFFSLQLQIPGQSAFPLDDQTGWAESAKRYHAYTGPFYVTPAEDGKSQETLRHLLQICVSPGEIGQVQVRSWKIEMEGEEVGSGKRRVLVLGTEEPVMRKGKLCQLELRWRKMADNSHGTPPIE